MTRKLLSRLTTALLVTVCCALVFNLATRVLNAGRRVPSGSAPAASGIPIGQTLAPLLVKHEGRDTAINLNSESWTLLIAASAGCVYCMASTRAWEFLLSRTCDLRVVAVFPAGDDLDSYRSLHGIRPQQPCNDQPLYAAVKDGRAFTADYGLTGTPTTYLITPDGRLATAWVGLFTAHRADSVLAYIDSRRSAAAQRGTGSRQAPPFSGGQHDQP